MLAVPLMCGSGGAWAAADLVFAQHTVAPDPVPAGGIATITMVVQNNGTDAASNVKLKDTIPPGSVFVGMTANNGGTCGAAGTDYECNWASIPYPGSATATLQVRLPSANTWENKAEVSSTTADNNTGNNKLDRVITATAAANLAIGATSSAVGTIAAGTPFNYTLTVRNDGGPDALPAGESPRVTFNVPGGTTIRARPTGSGWTCLPSGGYPLTAPTAGTPGAEITCTRNDGLAVGASFPAINVPAVANVTGTVTGTFTASSNFPDGNATDNTVPVDVELSAGTDMRITKTASLGAVGGVTQATFTLTARQLGGAPPTGVTVTDTLLAGMTYVSHTAPAPWACDFGATVAGRLTCTWPGTYDGGPYTDLPAISLVAEVTGAGDIPNTGMVTATPPDPDGANNSDTVTVNNSADLQINKWADQVPVHVNQNYNWVVRVRNHGPQAVLVGQTIHVTDQIPAGVTVRAAPAAPWTCTGPGSYPAAGPVTLSCSYTRTGSNLAVNTNAPDLVIPAMNTVDGATTNQACLGSDMTGLNGALTGTGPVESGTNPSYQYNCWGAGQTTSVIQADLEITKSASPNPVVVGQPLTYTLVATNLSSSVTATNVHVYDTVNNLLTSSSAPGLVSATSTQGTCTPAGPLNATLADIDCTVGTLAPGASATITIVVRPANTGRIALSRENTARVNSLDVGDPARGNNSTTINSDVQPRVDAAVSKAVNPSADVRVGQPMTYTVTARNLGPSQANELRITDVMPPNTAFISAGTPSNGGTCSSLPTVGAGGTLTCSWPNVDANATRTVTFVVRPLAAANGTNIDNTVNVAVGAADVETDTTNNSGQATTNVIDSLVDILVQKTDSVDPVPLAGTTKYTINVRNAGPSIGTNLVVTDTFPNAGNTARFSYQGNLTATIAGAPVPAPLPCTEPAVGAMTGTLTCTFPTVAVGQSNEVVLTYDMKAESIITAGDYSGTQGNHVSVRVDENETQMANNQVNEDTTTSRVAPVPPIDLGIVKTTTSERAGPGAEFDYTLTVTNHSATDVVAANGAQVTDTLPAGLTFVSATGCSYAAATRQVACVIPSLAAGANTAFTLRVQVDSPFTGTSPVNNTACVDMPGDPVGSNNCSTTPKEVGNPPPPASIPTLSEWGLIILSMLLAAFALRRMPLQPGRRM